MIGHEILILMILGSAIALGKLLVMHEPITIRVLIGRMILGAGLSMSAGAALIMFDTMTPTALIGVASALGILGQSALESLARRVIDAQPRRPDDDK
ncbi:holin [Burkholderia ubonensis]|uniref:holin n=1 Tax=Burkholderia ubonensis TaxID=101571 RepID=UPI00075AEFA1|nr:holin [Burkholderia ubonensis]KWI31904.1 holin [Burkholderia ubonensis]KWK63306.1 holin [Burkholderia ubonensis]OJB11835.1 holin [Burkholderia ubonensis]